MSAHQFIPHRTLMPLLGLMGLSLALTLVGSQTSLAQTQLTISQCRDKVRSNHPMTQAYDLVQQQADADLSNAQRRWLPNVSLMAGGIALTDIVDAEASPAAASLDFNNLIGALSISLSQNIYDGGAARHAKTLAQLQAQAQMRGLDVQLYNAERQADDLFFGILICNAMVECSNLLIADLEVTKQSVLALQKGGLASQADLLSVSVEQLKASQQRDECLANQQAYLAMLSTLMGTPLPSDVQLILPEADPQSQSSPADTSATNFDALPPMAQLGAQMEVTSQMIEQRRSALRPTLSLHGIGVAHTEVTPMVNNATLAAALTLNWNIGSLYSKANDISKLEAQRSQSVLQQKYFILAQQVELCRIQNRIDALRAQIEADDKIVAQREEIQRLGQTQAQGGTRSVNDLLQDVNAVNMARLQRRVHALQLAQEQHNRLCVAGLF